MPQQWEEMRVLISCRGEYNLCSLIIFLRGKGVSLLCSLIPSAFFQIVLLSRVNISPNHSLFAYSLQVHGHTRHISPLLHWCIPHNSWMRLGYYQPLLIILQLRSNISSGANMATFDNIFILRHVFNRLFIPHVLFGAVLPNARRGGFQR